MRKVISLILVLLFVCSAAGCAGTNTKETEKSTKDQVVEETKREIKDFPEPETITFEESDCVTGAVYNFTLEEFCEMMQKAIDEMGAPVSSFTEDDWKLLSKDLTDDNGIKYSTYYYSTDTIGYTVAVEKESKKIMNVGCGCSFEMFSNEEEDYQYSVLVMSSLIACVVGGYNIDNMEFMFNLFTDLIKSSTAFYYNNGIYMVDYDTEKEDSAVLFMMSPAQENILTDWALVDYKNS